MAYHTGIHVRMFVQMPSIGHTRHTITWYCHTCGDTTPMVGHWCHNHCFTRKVKCFTRKVKCFTRKVKCFTRKTKRFTRKANCFTRKTKILLYFNTIILRVKPFVLRVKRCHIYKRSL